VTHEDRWLQIAILFPHRRKRKWASTKEVEAPRYLLVQPCPESTLLSGAAQGQTLRTSNAVVKHLIACTFGSGGTRKEVHGDDTSVCWL